MLSDFEIIQPVDQTHYQELKTNHTTWLSIFPKDISFHIIHTDDVIPNPSDFAFKNIRFSKVLKPALNKKVQMFSVFAQPYLYSNAKYFIKFDSDNIITGNHSYDLPNSFNEQLDWQSQITTKTNESLFKTVCNYYDKEFVSGSARPLTNVLIYRSNWIRDICEKTYFEMLPVPSFSLWFWWCSKRFPTKYELIDYTGLFPLKHPV